MKKLLLILFICIMTISVVACGNPADGDSSGNSGLVDLNSTDLENNSDGTNNSSGSEVGILPDFESIMMGGGATDVVWGLQDEKTKQEIIAAGKADGVDVSFSADGSMTVVDPESGDVVTQKPDGTWVIKGADGGEGQIGGSWPDNEFTRLLPTPEFEFTAVNTTQDTFSVSFGSSVTLEQLRAYVEQIKARGFTLNAETTDQTVGTMVIYSYSASNASGYLVEVFFAMGTCGLSMSKPA